MQNTPAITEPAIQTGEEFYDSIMSQIEPDLVTNMLPLLDARYAAESPEEKDVRQARYDAAFEEFDRRSAEAMTALENDVHTYKVSSMREMESASRQEETNDISNLESSILSA